MLHKTLGGSKGVCCIRLLGEQRCVLHKSLGGSKGVCCIRLLVGAKVCVA